MSKLDGYKPFTVVRDIINRLELQCLIKLTAEKELVAELVTQQLIQAEVLREYINLDHSFPSNIHNTLENFITEGGRVIFIHRMDFDVNQGLLTLELKIDPQAHSADKTIVFRGIQDFEETVDEDEDPTDFVDSIIGLDQFSTRYVLRTELREIVFSSIRIESL